MRATIFRGPNSHMTHTRARHDALNCYCAFKPCLEWAEKHFNSVWPHWKDGIAEDMKEKITDIGLYGRRY